MELGESHRLFRVIYINVISNLSMFPEVGLEALQLYQQCLKALPVGRMSFSWQVNASAEMPLYYLG